MFSPPKSAYIISLLLILPLAVAGQKSEECQRRTVIVNVRDQNGRFIDKLPIGAFRGELRGQSVKLQSVDTHAVPRILVLLDASSSMTSNKQEWKLARMIAEDIFSSVPSDGQMALATFAGSIGDSVGFSSNRSAELQKLQEMQNAAGVKDRNKTALFDALLRVTAAPGSFMPGDVVYVITDGGEHSSRSRQKDVEQVLLARGIRLFAFVLIPPGPMTEEERFGPGLMQDLSRVTGGYAAELHP